jgi:hypothetical protein
MEVHVLDGLVGRGAVVLQALAPVAASTARAIRGSTRPIAAADSSES